MQPAEAARTVLPQIGAALRAAPRLGEVEIQLDPPELGRVRIGLEIADSGLKASLIAERPATGELLRSHGGILAQQLQEAGFTDIDLQFGAPQQDAGGGGAPGGRGEGGRDAGPGEASAEVARAGVATSVAGPEGIDLRF
jgi:flagellar hook-length control protein FliK